VCLTFLLSLTSFFRWFIVAVPVLDNPPWSQILTFVVQCFPV
jgi:hypothetical protein